MVPAVGEVDFEVGDDVAVRFTVASGSATLPEPELVPELRVSAAVDGEVVEGVWIDSGLFEVAVAGLEEGEHTIVPVVTIEIEDVPSGIDELTFSGSPLTVRVSAPPPTTTTAPPSPTTTTVPPPPPSPPRVLTDSIRLPDLRGAGTVVVNDAIAVIGGTVDGCVAVDDVVFDELPAGAGSGDATLSVGDPPLPSTSTLCVSGGPGSVEAGERETIAVSLTVDSAPNEPGEVGGVIKLVTVALAGSTSEYQIRFDGLLARERSRGALYGWYVGLVGLGLVLAGLLARRWANSTMLNRFTPDPNHLEVAARAVTIEGVDSGVVVTWSESTVPLDFSVVGGGPDPVATIEIPGDVAEVPGGLRLDAERLGGHISARGRVVGPGGSQQVPLELHGTWVFVETDIAMGPTGLVASISGTVVFFTEAYRRDGRERLDEVENWLVSVVGEGLERPTTDDGREPTVDIDDFYDD